MVCIKFSSIERIDFSWKCSFKTFEKEKVWIDLLYHCRLIHASRHHNVVLKLC